MNATETTYRFERWRAVSAGILETAGQTFLLLIAVRVLQAGPNAKALIASGQSVGLLLSLLVVVFVTGRGWRPAQAASRLAVLGAAVFLGMALVPTLAVIVLGSVVGLACLTASVPLMTQIYQDNYPEAQRGRLFSRTVMIRVVVAALFSAAAGEVLARNLGWYRGLLGVYAAAAAFAAFALSRCPSQPLTSAGGTHPLRALRFFREDRVFRWMLICWMVMGFANLMMVPMRVEYLANPRYGLEMTAMRIAVLTGVIPNAVRLALSPVWGRLFDRVNFFMLRVLLNLGFAAGILTFFTSNSEAGLIVGAMMFGASTAGGDVTWNLWVTKVAPADRVAEYMSVHTFFTGLRGLVAPLVAFHIITRLSIAQLGLTSAALIVLASLVLVREFLLTRESHPATALVERATK